MQQYQGKQDINQYHTRRQKSGFWKKFFVIGVCIVLLLSLAFGGYIAYLTVDLPKVSRLADYRPPVVSQVFGDDGTLVGEFYIERRKLVPIDKMPRKLIQAFVAAEDGNFYEHKGLDYLGIARAGFKNLIHLKKQQGASTITQQVAKSMLLTPERTFSRKIKEAILATRMEKMLTKDEILYIYLNQIYMGAGAYGVELASETYFGKTVDKLNLAEMAILAGLPKSPSGYSPIKHMDRAKERQAYVLDRMVKDGYISQAEADNARNTPIVLKSLKAVNNDQAAYFLEQVRLQLLDKYGEDDLYKGGLKIYTTMNANMQKSAYEAVINGLKVLDKRQGFRGVKNFLAENEVDGFCKKVEEGIDSASLTQGNTYSGVVVGVNPSKGDVTVRVGDRTGLLPRKNMAWAGKLILQNSYDKPEKNQTKTLTLGSVIEVMVVNPDNNMKNALFALDQTPEVQGALYSMDPTTGAVKAMIGGYDFKQNQFNRATQARRNPGSAFKPIIYAAALEHGMTAATVIEDSPVEFGNWQPRNSDGQYRGNVTMRTALTNSINIVSIKILESIGVDTAINFAKKIGITSNLEPNLTLALGASSVTPQELTSAYAVFASGGYRVTPYFITKVTDRDGNVLESNDVATPKVAPQPVLNDYSTSDSSSDDDNSDDSEQPQNNTEKVVQIPVLPSGAVQVVSPEISFIITNLMENVVNSGTGQRAKIGRPVAGKTGTTNDSKDAWFVGYVPQLVTGVWVGFDQGKSLGRGASGGQAAAPIWADFMKKAVADLPVRGFQVPSDIVFVYIDPVTGKLAKEGTPGSILEGFINGTEPTQYDE
ncbi:MAG: penicillin-binding protein 1A [Desulfuromonadales bacterium]|nr:penicillin-binding protein 1A [Desulfuromonadales bacterium]